MSDIETAHTVCDKVDAGTFGEFFFEELVHLFSTFFD